MNMHIPQPEDVAGALAGHAPFPRLMQIFREKLAAAPVVPNAIGLPQDDDVRVHHYPVLPHAVPDGFVKADGVIAGEV